MDRQSSDQELERRVRAVYEFERSQYMSILREDGVRYRVPRHCDGAGGPEGRRGASVWRRLIGACRERGIDPINYVQWSLSLRTLGLSRPPEPNQLLSRQNVGAYIRNRPNVRRSIELAVWLERQTAKRRLAYAELYCKLSLPKAWANVLGGELAELSPLFRYAAAHAIGGKALLRIASGIEDRASWQYQLDHVLYDECWEPLIPAGFARRSAEIYDRLIGFA